MKKSSYLFGLLAALILAANTNVGAQNSTMDDVHLFQSFFRDAPITGGLYGEGVFNYSDFDFNQRMTFGAQGGYGLTEEIEIAAGLYYRSIDFGEPGTESSLADIPVYGRYNFVSNETKFSAGAYATLPVGDEIIAEGDLDFGIFAAVRHPASDEVVITGTLGIDFLETGIDREASLYLGAGVIYAASERASIVSELSIQSDIDYSALSSGLDYRLGEFIRFRAALLLGVDDAAPDYGVTGSFLVNL
ncbi:MAG: hypothetical protein R3222_08490 [Balneolaceae bacterium]|nr:hypothetical protein [Balneolaceae bacterium]